MNHQSDPVSFKQRNQWIPVGLMSRVSLLVMILVTVYMLGGSDRQLASTDKRRSGQSTVSSADKLPSGLEHSDWNGILEAHQACMHSIKADRQIWRTHTHRTGLTATFDGSGFEVRPESGDWRWGLELVSYGRGHRQVSVGNRKIDVSATEQQINYQWDQNLEDWRKNDTCLL